MRKVMSIIFINGKRYILDKRYMIKDGILAMYSMASLAIYKSIRVVGLAATRATYAVLIKVICAVACFLTTVHNFA